MDDNFRKPQKYSIKFYLKLDYLYEMLKNDKNYLEDVDTKRFYDGTKISNWLKDNLYKLERLKDENIKAKYILDIINNKKNDGKPQKFYKKLEEVYKYYLKTGTLPTFSEKILFEDKTNMYNWLISYMIKLELIRDENKMANAILTEYRKSDMRENNFNEKLKQVYESFKNNNGLNSDQVILFSDGTSINNWIKTYSNRMREIKDENEMAYAILSIIDERNKEQQHKAFNEKAEEIYEYYLRTDDLLMEGKSAKFKNEMRYKNWLINMWNLKTLKNMNKRVYKLALAQLLNKSLLYDKKLLETYKYCITTGRIPNEYTKSKFTNGHDMGTWLRNNKYFIWVKKKNNPYCMLLVKAILEIKPKYFNCYISDEEDKLTTSKQNKVLFKIRK